MRGKKLTQDEYIELCKKDERHINIIYDDVIYKNSSSNCIFICNIHGHFIQNARGHLRGQSCPKCGLIKAHLKTILNTEEFIRRAILIHGDRYDYSLVVYINVKTKIKIICKIHGVFEVLPLDHLRFNCKLCSIKETHDKQKKTTEKFIQESIEIHGEDTFDYIWVNYTISKNDVILICNKHNFPFKIKPTSHLNQKAGCPICGNEKRTKSITYTQEEFIDKSLLIWGDKNDYSDTIYINYKFNIVFRCKIHNLICSQRPNGHLMGEEACSLCNSENLKNNKLELKLFNFIKENFIDYDIIHQYRPKWLITNKTNGQSLDIYLPELNIGIEYQGCQHFKKYSFFGGEKGFKDQQERDERKRLKCIENNCKLYYFTYKKSEVPADYPHKVYTDEQELIQHIKQYIETLKTNE